MISNGLLTLSTNKPDQRPDKNYWYGISKYCRGGHILVRKWSWKCDNKKNYTLTKEWHTNLHTNHPQLYLAENNVYARQVINCAITMRTDMRAKRKERRNLMKLEHPSHSYHAQLFFCFRSASSLNFDFVILFLDLFHAISSTSKPSSFLFIFWWDSFWHFCVL